jgi:hypothetical protein
MTCAENSGFDVAELERAVKVHFRAGFDGLPFPLQEVWPGSPGKAYCFEMVRREFGWAGFEYAKRLKIFTSH